MTSLATLKLKVGAPQRAKFRGVSDAAVDSVNRQRIPPTFSFEDETFCKLYIL
jgi:hypothetical protein